MGEILPQDLVQAAQRYDLARRPPGNWTRVPDTQVLRLLAGALAELASRLADPLTADPDALLGQGSGPAERRDGRA
jgi:hypothetical protein